MSSTPAERRTNTHSESMTIKTIALILVLAAAAGVAYLVLAHPAPSIMQPATSTAQEQQPTHTAVATTTAHIKKVAMPASVSANDKEQQAVIPGPKPTPAVVANPSGVSIDNYTFVPGNRTIKKGTTVTWTNHDIASHTITGDTGGPQSGLIPQGGRYSYTFTSVGTFPYHCEPHPYMKGIITVTE